MPKGTAKDVATIWWQIVDDNDGELARFDHRIFKDIRDGATVTYIDADGDGIAEKVQPAAAITRYIERVAPAETLDEEQETQLLLTILTELHEAREEAGSERQKRLRRLRATLDRYEI